MTLRDSYETFLANDKLGHFKDRYNRQGTKKYYMYIVQYWNFAGPIGKPQLQKIWQNYVKLYGELCRQI